ncbi:MAG: ATP-binding protein [Nanoarchaeota archaeon]
MEKAKINEFFKALNEYPLDEIDKNSIKFIVEYFQKKYDAGLSSRSFIFTGNPGVGKTYLAEKLLNLLEKEVVYLGCAKIKLNTCTVCSTLKNILSKISSNKEQIIFMDDLNYLFDREEYSVASQDKRDFMRILETVKRNPNKMLLCTMNNYGDLDEQMIDRIEVKIEFDIPTDYNKRSFLKANFSRHVSAKSLNFIARNSIGYNYRDLPEMLKMAYRIGNGNLDVEGIRAALKIYKPTQLYGYSVENGITLKLKDIIGKKEPLNYIKKIIQIYRNEGLSKKLGLRRANLLLFHGPPGTGKTFVAKALAGEIGFPLINIRGGNVHGSSFHQIHSIGNMAKRYRNCVIFIDEAEKIFGNARFGEDNPLIGEFNMQFDCLNDNDIKSIVVLSVNELSRFGGSFTDRFVQIEFKNPEYEERLAFCRMKVEQSRRYIPYQINYEHLAKQTEKFSFRDIERIWNDLMFYYLEKKGGINENVISSIIRGVRPQENNILFG